tara:strand:+ start:1058 stop:1939 length:882 start_codon:yes stop_codon:yes gene_type:complete
MEETMSRKKPIVYITENDWNKLLNYAQCAYEEFGTEIGGMAEMVPDKDGDMWIKRPTILKQSVAPANCDLNEGALAQYYATVAKKNGTSDFLWWHSHADMTAFWSQTDKNTIEDNKGKSKHTWSLVINIKGEYIMQLDVFFLAGMKLHKSQEFKLCFIRRNYTDAFKKKVIELCDKEVAINQPNHIGYYRGWMGNNMSTGNVGTKNPNQQQLALPKIDGDFAIINDTDDDGLALFNKASDMVDYAMEEFHNDKMTFPEFQKHVENANKVWDGYRVPTLEGEIPLYTFQLEKQR